MLVKENVFECRINKYELINKFRNSDITQHLTSVYTEEVFSSDGYIAKIVESFVCEKLEFNSFERFNIHMTNKRKKFREENKTLLQTLTKTVTISECCGCIRRDFEESYECVTQNWMRHEYEDSIVE